MGCTVAFSYMYITESYPLLYSFLIHNPHPFVKGTFELCNSCHFRNV